MLNDTYHDTQLAEIGLNSNHFYGDSGVLSVGKKYE